MDEPLVDVGAPPVASDEPKLDPRRVRSFVGLSLGRLGPRAFGAVAGIFLALLVAERTDSLLMVTFALTAHRFVTWLAFPIAGRLSDRSHMSIGRRVPYMGGGLIVAGVCTALFTHADNFWALVGLLMITRLAMVAYTLPSAAITPEAFGKSRWVRAGVAVAILGAIVGLSIRVTAIATWNQDDPTTWTTSYYLSAGYIVFAGLAIVLLVREVPAAKELVRDHPTERFRETLSSVLQAPNAAPLLWTLLCSVAAGGAFSRAYPIYAEEVLGAGGDALSAAGIWSAILGIVLFPLSLVLAGTLSRKHNLFWAAITGGGTAVAHLWVTELWQSVVLGAFSGIFLVASSLTLAPMYLQILPRKGGLAERIGVGFAPILIAGMVAAFLTGFAYDVIVEDYRVIWIPTAVFSFGAGLPLLWMKIPAHAKHADLKHGWLTVKRLLWGKKEGRELFRGDIDHHEADGAALIELVADELNPYIDRGL